MSSVASLRQIRRRIRSVENTRKITRAMEMVAAAKLRRFQDFLESARPYTEKLQELLDELLRTIPSNDHHPYLRACLQSDRGGPPLPSHAMVVLFTSDTGLCGTYNSELEKTTREWLRQNSDKKVSFLFVGKQGAHSFQKTQNRPFGTFSDLRVSRVEEVLQEVRKNLETAFFHSEVDEIYAVYTFAENLSRYEPRVEKILPIDRKKVAEEKVSDDLIEPDPKTVLERLLPAFFEARLRFILYHALLTEQIARMTAMRQATQNAKEMIDELTLTRNKARQASITKEIIEIVSGSRALKMK